MKAVESRQRDHSDPESLWVDGAATVGEAASWLKCSRRTVFRMIESGELPSRLVLGRRLIPVSSLRRLLPAPACGGTEAFHIHI